MQETKGTKIKDWDEADISVEEDVKDNVPTDTTNQIYGFLNNVPKLLKDVESNNLAFTASLASLIGYIIIATFGHMGFKDYLEYLLFLFILFCVYKFSRIEKGKRIFDILLIIAIILLIIIISQNHNYIYTYLLKIYNIFNKLPS